MTCCVDIKNVFVGGGVEGSDRCVSVWALVCLDSSYHCVGGPIVHACTLQVTSHTHSHTSDLKSSVMNSNL